MLGTEAGPAGRSWPAVPRLESLALPPESGSDDAIGTSAGATSVPRKPVVDRSDVVDRLKREIESFSTAADEDRHALAEAKEEVRLMKDLILRLQAAQLTGESGATSAIADNNRVIAKHEEVMEKRLVKARALKMTASLNNAKQRERIDDLRREKQATLMLHGALREDGARMAAAIAASSAKVAALLARLQEVEAQQEGLAEEGRMEMNSLSAELKRVVDESRREDSRVTTLQIAAAQLASGEKAAAAAAAAAPAAGGGASGRTGADGGGGSLDPRRAAPRRRQSLGSTAHGATAAELSQELSARPFARKLGELMRQGKQPTIDEMRATIKGKRPSLLGGGTTGAGGLGLSASTASLGPGSSAGGAAGHPSPAGLRGVGGHPHAMGALHSDSAPDLMMPRPTGAAAAMLARSRPQLHRSASGSGGAFDAMVAHGGGGTDGRGHSPLRTGTSFRLRVPGEGASTKGSPAMLGALGPGGRLEVLHEAFERALSVTEAPSLQAFVAAFNAAAADNQHLYGRLADLTREAEDLRSRLVGEWALAAVQGQRSAAEEAGRAAAVARVHGRLALTRQRIDATRADGARLAALADVCRAGLLRLLDVLQGEMAALDEVAHEAASGSSSGGASARGSSSARGSTTGRSAGAASARLLSGGGAGGGEGSADAGGASGPAPSAGEAAILAAPASAALVRPGTATSTMGAGGSWGGGSGGESGQSGRQDIVGLYTRAEALLATVLSMYSRHVHGTRIPIAMPPAVLAQALQHATRGGGAGGGAGAGGMQGGGAGNAASRLGLLASSGLLSTAGAGLHRPGLAPLGAQGRRPSEIDPAAIASRAAAAASAGTQGRRRSVVLAPGLEPITVDLEKPSERGGVVTLTASERRASLEMSLIDMRKGLITAASSKRKSVKMAGPSGEAVSTRGRVSVHGPEHAAAPAAATGASPAHSARRETERGRSGTPSQSGRRPSQGSTAASPVGGSGARSGRDGSPASGTRRSVAGGPEASGGEGRPEGVAPLHLPSRSSMRQPSPVHGGMPGSLSGRPATANTMRSVGGTLLSPSPVTLSLAELRVGPDAPGRVHSGTVAAMASPATGPGGSVHHAGTAGGAASSREGGPRRRHSIVGSQPGALATGVIVVPPPVDGAAATRILAQASQSGDLPASVAAHMLQASVTLPGALGRGSMAGFIPPPHGLSGAVMGAGAVSGTDAGTTGSGGLSARGPLAGHSSRLGAASSHGAGAATGRSHGASLPALTRTGTERSLTKGMAGLNLSSSAASTPARTASSAAGSAQGHAGTTGAGGGLSRMGSKRAF